MTETDTDDAIEGIAIIGIAGRFPDAADPSQFWQNLCEGRESITRFAPMDAEDSFDADVRGRSDYVGARAILEGVDQFDAAFFGMQAREAELTDPQHRVFLECAWEALEDAGYDPSAFGGAIGVFGGASMSTYFLRHVLANPRTRDEFVSNYQLGSYPMLLGALPDVLATRVSYKLGLRGPAMTVQTACSTSLVAVAQACQSLLLYQSDMALAGGVSITFPQKRGYLYHEGGMASSDGHCRTFDAASSGTVFGAGAGVVLLKRLSEAQADGDHIYAVIRGTAINNDGAGKVGFTAPSVDGQAAVIMAAQAMAGCLPETIGYVECHGTATPLGDPIEIAGLVKAFGTDQTNRQFCALGSVKTNIGHLDVAAGVAGLIKTALTLKHGKLPGTVHFHAPNPRIDFAATPFFVNAALSDWPKLSGPRRAGVSAFGVGGTNVHAVLEEAPLRSRQAGRDRPQLLVLSARTKDALTAARARLADHLRANPDLALPDIAYTLQVGRRGFAQRVAVVARNRDDAIAKLDAAGVATAASVRARDGKVPVAFLFPGQGAQYPRMGQALYENEPAFRDAMDRCSTILTPLLGRDLCDILYGTSALDADALRETRVAQPAIFAVEYALAQLWISWGVQPAAMIGHSVGEFVAACLSGVMDLEPALTLVALRGRLLQALPPGGMVAVRLSEADLAPLLPAGVDLAAVNGPALCVAAGPFEGLAVLETRLTERGASFRPLATSHAFHSAMMEPALAELAGYARGVRLNAPRIPYVSGVTGCWITDQEATAPDYWARHCREPVRFADGISCLVAADDPILLEVGPGRALTGMAKQGAGRGATVVSSLPEPESGQTDLESFLATVGRLWVAGVHPDWARAHGAASPMRVSLPTYPFERRRYWIDAPAPVTAEGSDAPHAIVAEQHVGIQQMTNEPIVAVNPDAGAKHHAAVRTQMVTILEGLSGEDLSTTDPDATFLELGFDSLLLGQFVQQLEGRFGVQIGFRALLGDLPTIAALTDHLAALVPPEPVVEAPVERAFPPPAAAIAMAPPPVAAGAPMSQESSIVERVMRDQLQAMQALMAQQLDVLRGGKPVLATPVESRLPANPPVVRREVPAPAPAPVPAVAPEAGQADEPSRFNVYKPGGPVSGRGAEMTEAQRQHVASLVARYNQRTGGSKRRTQDARPLLADPRAAAGFRSEWKDLVYPVVCARSKGSRIWDVDGNEYIDLVNGYGQVAFGHAPDFVVKAVQDQLGDGFAIGPQSPLSGEVAALFAELTGNQRMTFCNTGSEAVMAAMRVARTVTGRSRIVMFSGDYHGQFDEVLVKGARTGRPRALPAVPGVPQASVRNIVVLPYGEAQSLDWIRANASDLAAVIVEPVQSRHPELRPREFVQDLRDITAATGAALVFDEVVTGFRVHPAGMQGVWGIKGDLATYGKIMGGGMPIGVLAGVPRFMDALDGGMWQYGDASFPEIAPTFFAGTFVRHPLVLAACRAVLLHMKGEGPGLLRAAAERTERLGALMNEALAGRGLRTRVTGYSSWLHASFAGDGPYATLIWHHLRNRGIHVQDGFPLFLTTEHTDADVDTIVEAFRDSLDEMRAVGLVGSSDAPVSERAPELPAETSEITVPLTPSQTEILLAAQLDDDASCAFNESLSVRLDGALDRAALVGALQDVVARFDALRARISAIGQEMVVAPALTLAVPEHDFSADPAALDDLIEQDAATAFSLSDGPLVRAHLARVGPRSHVLVLTAHHIICDGWSTNVLLDALSARYAARCGMEARTLGPAPRFSVYARQLAARGVDARTEAYWIDQVAEPPPSLDLPTDRRRPIAKSFQGATYRTRFDADETAALKRAGARLGCTLFMTLLGGFQLLLGRLGGQRDIMVGVPMAAQSQLDDGALVGHCVNFLPLRAQWTDETTLREFLTQVRNRVLNAREHQDYTLGTLVRRLNVPREPGRIPLVEVQFNLEQINEGQAFSGLTVECGPNPKRFVNFDLFLNAIESDNGLRIDVDYNTDLFDESTIERWIGSYRALLLSMIADQTALVGRLAILPDDQSEAILVTANRTEADYPAHRSMDQLFGAWVERQPDAVAVLCGGATCTYRDLDLRANRIARYLMRHVTTPGARVGVMMNRSADLLAALMAVMRAGFAYIPLDPSHPPARVARILQQSGAAAVMTDGSALAPADTVVIDLATGAAPIAAMDPGPLPSHPSDRTAYVIYTSGSTGQPKGVEITHRSLTNLLCAMADKPGFSGRDRLLAVTTIAFDIAALELYLPLVCGGTVEIATSAELRDPVALLRLLDNQAVTVTQATPSLWRLLLEAGFRSRPTLKMICGGEALDRDLADRLLNGGGELWNAYGPTETTIWSAVCRIWPDENPITIGGPIANTQFYVLDENDQPLPVGVPGELYIGGDGLALGYVGQPELTRASFRTLKLGNLAEQLVYRAGDVARWNADGTVTVLGRRDNQVKLRGFRIELGEIEAALSRLDSIAGCAVLLRHDVGSHPSLVCYYVPSSARVADGVSLRDELSRTLPDYMVPAFWVPMERLPLTPNGKLDRAALPPPHPELRAERDVTQPRTSLEAILLGIWDGVLKCGTIGVNDNLFSLGADSLHVFQIASRMAASGIELSASHLLRNPTVADLATTWESLRADSVGATKVPSLHEFRRGARRRVPAIESTGSSR